MAAASAPAPSGPGALASGPPGANSIRGRLIAAPVAGLLRVRSCSMSGRAAAKFSRGGQTALAARRDAIIASG